MVNTDLLIVSIPLLVSLAGLSIMRGSHLKASVFGVLTAYVAYYATYAVISPEGGAWWIPTLQMVAALVVTTLMLGGFGSKISRPSYLTIFTLIAVYPAVPAMILPFIITLAVGGILAFAVGLRKLRKYEEYSGESEKKMRAIVMDASLDLGLLTKQLPDGSHMEAPESLPDELKTRIAPAYLAGAILGIAVGCFL